MEIKNLVLVDDNYLVLKGLVRGFTSAFASQKHPRWKWIIHTHSTPQGVMDAIQRCSVDVIITDWDMPCGGGRAVMDAAEPEDIPVIIYTGGVGCTSADVYRMQSAAKVYEKGTSCAEMARFVEALASKK